MSTTPIATPEGVTDPARPNESVPEVEQVGDTFDPRLAAIRARKEARRRQRIEFALERAAGLKLRHAAKLRHLKLSQKGEQIFHVSPLLDRFRTGIHPIADGPPSEVKGRHSGDPPN